MSDFDRLPKECDDLCQWRACLHKGHHKGTYAPGRGYTSYYKNPENVCMTRLIGGCPGNDCRPLPDIKKMLADLESEIIALAMTQKARRHYRKTLDIIRLIAALSNCEGV